MAQKISQTEHQSIDAILAVPHLKKEFESKLAAIPQEYSETFLAQFNQNHLRAFFNFKLGENKSFNATEIAQKATLENLSYEQLLLYGGSTAATLMLADLIRNLSGHPIASAEIDALIGLITLRNKLFMQEATHITADYRAYLEKLSTHMR